MKVLGSHGSLVVEKQPEATLSTCLVCGRVGGGTSPKVETAIGGALDDSKLGKK